MRKDNYIQALRGIAIAAVVLIHSLPADNTAVIIIRSFINFPVAMFVFFSGDLTKPIPHDEIKQFYKHRLSKILAPYITWTIIYIIIARDFSPIFIVASFAFGKSASQMYYLVTYLQLILLAPAIPYLMKRYRLLMYVITPIVIGAYVTINFIGVDSAIVRTILTPFVGTWLIYYLIGYDWRNKAKWVVWCRNHSSAITTLAFITIALQIIDSFILYRNGSRLATSQLKLSVILTSIFIILAFMSVDKTIRRWFADNRLFVWLGNLSFGIYLAHMALLICINAVLKPLGLPWYYKTPFVWLVALFGTALIVHGCRKILPKRINQILGFIN